MKKILLRSLAIFVLQSVVSASVIPYDFISSNITTERSVSSLSDNINTNCDVMLNFSNMGFKYIASTFITSLYVKNLTLRNNSITEFEKGAFDGLPNLEYLDASRNQLSLTSLFTFGGHLKLKTLILDYNCLQSLCLPQVKDIHELESEAHRRTIRSPKRYRYGSSYDDDENDFDNIDDFDMYIYGRSTTTTTVRTTTRSPESYRRRLKINPLYYFPELETLSLRKINADSISADLSFNFPKLKYLDLSENGFYEPSINVYNNIPSTVLYLLMESSDLKSVRSQQFKNITTLKLNQNKFDKISNGFCNESDLCLQSMFSLQFLFVSGCSISIVDADAFKDTASLLELDISNNQIVDLPKETFYNTPSLSHLDLSKNNLKEIPDFSILRNLSSLILDNMQNVTIFNSLSSFSFMPNLSVISMSKNKLKVIPQIFLENLPVLRVIDLSYNEIISLPPFTSQIFLSKLYLSFNRISNIDDLSLNNAASLEVLDLKSNPILGFKVASLEMLPKKAFILL